MPLCNDAFDEESSKKKTLTLVKKAILNREKTFFVIFNTLSSLPLKKLLYSR